MYIFEIYGVPPVQKQTRHCTKNGRSWSYDPSKKDKERIQWQIRPTAPEKPLTGPVELTIAFFLPIPKATSSKTRRAMINRLVLPIVRPDEDNLAYLVTNVLNQLVYEDDRQICAKHVFKFYGETPKTVIKVRPILQIEEVGYHACDI